MNAIAGSPSPATPTISLPRYRDKFVHGSNPKVLTPIHSSMWQASTFLQDCSKAYLNRSVRWMPLKTSDGMLLLREAAFS